MFEESHRTLHFDPVRGYTYRRLAHRAILEHRSQSPGPMEELFEPIMEWLPLPIEGRPEPPALIEGLPSLFTSLGSGSDRLAGDLSRDFESLESSLDSPTDLAREAIALQRRLGDIEAPSGSELTQGCLSRVRPKPQLLASRWSCGV